MKKWRFRMKEYVEKLIERLEEAGKYHLELSEANKMDVRESHRHKSFAGVYGKAIEIVKYLASEYNNDFCEWKFVKSVSDGGYFYSSGCSHKRFSDLHSFEFCPYCGKEIKIIPAPYKKGE
jgi:rRNA maturation endonuclease Nob1